MERNGCALFPVPFDGFPDDDGIDMGDLMWNRMLEFGIRYERRGCGGIICSCLVRGAHHSLQFFVVVSLSVCLARLYCSRQTFSYLAISQSDDLVF
jgi:hypothetical protein